MCNTKTVNASLYGGVPGHTTLDPVFIREMEYEVTRLTRQPLVHFDNDAKSCYDRIPCFLANVASQKYGMNAKVCTAPLAVIYGPAKLGGLDFFHLYDL